MRGRAIINLRNMTLIIIHEGIMIGSKTNINLRGNEMPRFIGRKTTLNRNPRDSSREAGCSLPTAQCDGSKGWLKEAGMWNQVFAAKLWKLNMESSDRTLACLVWFNARFGNSKSFPPGLYMDA